jgi:hypothetical protein
VRDKSNLLSENKRKENKHMNETLNVNLNNLTEEERNTLLALVEKCAREPEPKVWKPEIGDEYFYVKTNGEIGSAGWDDIVDKDRYALGDCFRTKEEAKFAREKLKVIAELKRFAQKYNTEEIDWNNKNQPKYRMYYSYNTKHIRIESCFGVKYNDIYFSSREIVEQAVKEIGEERILF